MLCPKPIVVGYDMRFMSRSFAEAFAEVLAYEGIEVWLMSGPALRQWSCLLWSMNDLTTEQRSPHHTIRRITDKGDCEEGKDAPIEVTDELESIIRSLSNEQ